MQHRIDMTSSSAIRNTMKALFDEEEKSRKKAHRTISYYHYTTPAAFISIFKTYIESSEHHVVTECSMRATHLRFMNDTQEYNDGKKLFAEKWEKEHKGPFSMDTMDQYEDEIYSISFCSNRDLLSQWKWYGKDSGIAIQFDMTNIAFKYYEPKFEIFEPSAWTEDEKKHFIKVESKDMLTKPLAVKYLDDDKERFYDDVKAELQEAIILQSFPRVFFKLFVPFCKNTGFKEEEESRLVFFPVQDRNIQEIPIKYHVTNGIIKPSLDITFHAIDPSKNIIKEIVVGPGHNQDMTVQLLKLIFRENEELYNNIRRSNIPFRG